LTKPTPPLTSDDNEPTSEEAKDEHSETKMNCDGGKNNGTTDGQGHQGKWDDAKETLEINEAECKEGHQNNGVLGQGKMPGNLRNNRPKSTGINAQMNNGFILSGNFFPKDSK
jgi:hypothetical protein